MSTTKKWMLVLLSVCFLFSLAFGITIAGHAEGETEIEWPDIITTSDWSGNTELRIPSNLKNLNNQQLTYDNSMLGKVKITRGETTFACSHIYEWNGELTFYFNGSNYTGKTPQAGDVLSIDAGLQVSNKANNLYKTEEAISWTYDGTVWVKTDATATVISFPSSIAAGDWNSETEVRIPSNLQNNNQGGLTYSSSMLSLVKIVRGSQTFACSHIYEWGGKLTFYFNGSGYTGKTAPQPGDQLIISAGLQVTNKNGLAYYTTEEISYTCDGVGWVQDREMPDRDLSSLKEIEIESVTTTDSIGGEKDSVIFINTTSTNTADFGDDNYDDTYAILP